MLADDEFGSSVAIAGGTIVAGAPTTQTGAGQAYVFGPGPTSTSVGCSSSDVVVGQPFRCTATVTDTAPGPTTPSGSVSFGNGGSCALAGSGGSARCSVSFTSAAAGTQTVTAAYGGDLEHAASRGSASKVISKAGTSTGVISSKNTATGGFTVSDIRTHRNGMVSFAVKVPGSGAIDVLETAWKDNSARIAALLQPAPRRFVYARARKIAERARTVRFRVKPNRRGRKLVRHHR